MKLIFFLLITITIAAAYPLLDEVEVTVDDAEWEDFKTKHNKSYADSNEETKRRGIFLESKKKISEHNKKYDAGEVTYKLGINQFSDLTHEEFSEKLLRNH